MTSENIRNYCEEALNITEEQGVHDGLAFLIGEKFSLAYYQLKAAQNKLKYLYPDSTSGNQNSLVSKESKTLQLSYALTISENYRGIFEQVDHLEEALDQFIKEIKQSFSTEKIQDYLNSYPRLVFKGDFSPDDMDSSEEGSSMTAQDIFSEVEDILIVDEMKSLFT